MVEASENCPYYPDQVVGVFCVPRTLNNYMLEPLEAAMAGVFAMGFVTAYSIVYLCKIGNKLSKYFKGIKK